MSLDYRIKYFDELESTNKYAKDLAKEGVHEGIVIIAGRQNGGYGRMGRSFYSPGQSGLYMSLILRPAIDAQDALLITAAAAAAVSCAIDDISGKKSGIKWVNDVFIGQKKVCGILCESAFDPIGNGLSYVILGIGVNLYTPDKGFPTELRDIAGSVFSSPLEEGTKERLLSKILEYFDGYYKALTKKEYYKIYKKKCFIIGKDVTVIRGTQKEICRVVDLETDFRLRVRDHNNNEILLDSGEISIRL